MKLVSFFADVGRAVGRDYFERVEGDESRNGKSKRDETNNNCTATGTLGR